MGKRQQLELLRSQLEIERSSFMTTWRECGDYILPRRPRFNLTDANRGDRRNQKIIDSTGTMAAGTLRAGMMSGVTSPARPWFRLTTPDPKLAEVGPVKEWLHEVTTRMNTIFLRSNLYNVLPIIYGDMGVFGTGCAMIEEDLDDGIRVYPFAIGSYMLGNDHRLKVNVFVRDFRMTVRQLLQKFGERDSAGKITNWDNFSSHVRSLAERNQLEAWIDVCHVIKPNQDYDPYAIHASKKKFMSCYFERGNSGQGQAYIDTISEDRFLRESGYDFFPILAPRWEVTGEDVYGTQCPGVNAIGDIKALQLMQRRKAEAIEKQVRPPLQAPIALKNQKMSLLPGDVTFVTDIQSGQGVRPIMQVDPRLDGLIMNEQEHQNRIRRAFYEDLFLMLAATDRSGITAREIDERHEEKLLALGPVLEQLNQDLLDPLIDNTFAIMLRRGDVPPAPEELQGMDLRVDYISIMAQAQKLVGVSGLERFSVFAAQAAQVNPESLDKVDFDEMLTAYGDAVGLSPKIIRADEMVEQMRQARGQAQQAQAQAEQVQAMSQSAKNLAQAPVEGDQQNALMALLQQSQAGALA